MTLNDYMKNNGMTDQKLADELGVSRSTVTQYRLGDRMPRPEILLRLLAATDNQVSPVELVGSLKRAK
jgi:transcriptional regulator with XRE-family HTH domain